MSKEPKLCVLGVLGGKEDFEAIALDGIAGLLADGQAMSVFFASAGVLFKKHPAQHFPDKRARQRLAKFDFPGHGVSFEPSSA